MKIDNLKMKKLSTLNSQLSTRKGFTLIELLIVIVIIGVLATILLANFIGVRQRSRDAQRKADLRQLQSAVELYKADQNSYPSSSLVCEGALKSPDLSVTYMAKIPCDPNPILPFPLPLRNYTYVLSGSTYTLYACIENLNDTDPNVFVDDASCSNTRRKYLLTNP